MYKSALFIGFFLLFAPAFAMAQTPSCLAQGYTVVFVNGIFDSEIDANADKNQLQIDYDKGNGGVINGQPVTFQLGYNPTHLGGAGDLVQSFAQQFNSSLSDFDLDTILLQIYPEVTTRKLLIVGHSQGAQYANEMYSYLLAHGEPNDSVGVYAVATPASFVAGGGKYITSDADKVISAVTTAAMVANEDGLRVPLPLPANAYLTLTATDIASGIGGHMFADDYLAQAAPQIQSDIDGELLNLQPTDAGSGDCFTPPPQNAAYKAQAAAFAVADPAAAAVKGGTAAAANTAVAVANAVKNVAVGAWQMFADAVHITAAPPSNAQTTQDTEKVINKLYGSSLDGLSAQDQKDLLGSSQGSAVVLAVAPAQIKSPTTTGVVLDTSTVVQAATFTPSAQPKIDPNFYNWTPGGGGGVQAAADVVDEVGSVDSTGASAPDTSDTSAPDNTVASDTPPVADDTPAPLAPVPSPFITFCSQYSDHFVNGGQYAPTDEGDCEFDLPSITNAYYVFDIYLGTPGNAALVDEYNARVQATSDIYPLYAYVVGPFHFDQELVDATLVNAIPPQGEDFFSAVYGADTNQDLVDAAAYLSSGAGPVPANLQIIQWKWGTASQ